MEILEYASLVVMLGAAIGSFFSISLYAIYWIFSWLYETLTANKEK